MRGMGTAEDDELARVAVIDSPRLTMVAHSGRREQVFRTRICRIISANPFAEKNVADEEKVELQLIF